MELGSDPRVGQADGTGEVTAAEAIAALAAITERDAHDPETAHANADDVLLAFVPADVRAAYVRVVDACRWWACA